MQKNKGFTLIELMIVVVIVSVLAMVALPSYTDYVIRTKRADAEGALMVAVNAMERLRANNFTYAATDAGGNQIVPFATAVPSDGSSETNYTLSLSSVTATTYTITATAVNAQATAVGNAETLTINQNGVKNWSGSANSCWPGSKKNC